MTKKAKAKVAIETKVKATKATIDDLFGKIKESKLESKEKQKKHEEMQKEVKEASKSETRNLPRGLILPEGVNFIISPEAPLERIDKESGLPVYKAHLLKVGEGGGTPLCPFDCECCF